MELRRIQYFVTLAEYLHFSQAADSLYISQSTLSYHIAELELELGVQLFTRNKRKVALTKTATELLPIAKEILAKVEELTLAASRQNLMSDEVIRMQICFDISSPRFDLFGIDEAIVQMRKLYPDAEINCCQSSMEDILSGLSTLNYDLGFVTLRHGEKLDTKFNVLPIHTDILSVVSIFDMSLGSLSQIFEKKALYLLKDDTRWNSKILFLLKELGITPEVRWENNFSSMLTRVTTGEGITVLPRSEFRAEVQSRPTLKALDFQSEEAKVYSCALWHESNCNTGILPLISQIRSDDSEVKDDGSFF